MHIPFSSITFAFLITAASAVPVAYDRTRFPGPPVVRPSVAPFDCASFAGVSPGPALARPAVTPFDCASFANVSPAANPAPPTHPAPPPIPDNAKIVVNGITYTLAEKLGIGMVGAVYAIKNEKKVAKVFRTHYKVDPSVATSQKVAWTRETDNSRIVIGPEPTFNAGESPANGAGEIYAWLITPRVYGHLIREAPGLLAEKAKGFHSCTKFVTDVLRPEFKRELIALAKRSQGLIHLDAHYKNTFWDANARKIAGFVDFDQMDVVGGPLHKAKLAWLTSPKLSEHMTGSRNTAWINGLVEAARASGKQGPDLGLDVIASLFSMFYFPNHSTDLCGPKPR